MDNYSDHPGAFDAPAASAAPAADVASAIGADERRMHVRAYNYWCSLLGGRDYPSIEDLEPGDVQDFGPHAVLLDFTSGQDNPATPYIGSAIREECGLAADGVRSIDDVPSRSLLSRLTDHYMQIIANRAPVGFEAEFVNQRGRSICYRGILMPFSSDGDAIDFIYGVINWKDGGESDAVTQVIRPALPPLPPEIDEEEEDGNDEYAIPFAAAPDPVPAPGFSPAAIADPYAIPIVAAEPEAEPVPPAPHMVWEDGPLADPIDDEPMELVLDDDAGLADRLWAARETAEVCKQADGRSRAALYNALAMAYDFAVAAKRVPDDYAEILDDAGVTAQARAPMTPIVKLVFGIDYDKARVTEFAAALSQAERQAVDFGGFKDFVEKADGGLKGLVAAERKARRPQKADTDKGETGRAALRAASAISLDELATNAEFAIVLTRRNAAGIHEPVCLVNDPATLEKLIRRVG